MLRWGSGRVYLICKHCIVVKAKQRVSYINYFNAHRPNEQQFQSTSVIRQIFISVDKVGFSLWKHVDGKQDNSLEV